METGKVVANIMQMDECIAQIRQASTTVTEATNTVDSHNRALPPDRYDSEAARQYRANYTGASRKLVDVQDTLTILANNLENARERIMQASGVTDQMIIDQKIRVSELNGLISNRGGVLMIGETKLMLLVNVTNVIPSFRVACSSYRVL